MTKLMQFELKKIIDKKMVRLFIIVVFIIVGNIYLTNYSKEEASFRKGKQTIVKLVEGPITQSKVDFVKNSLQENIEIVNQGDLETEKISSNTYTGFVFGDMNAFQEVHDDLYRVFNYKYEVDMTVGILDENIEKSKSNIIYEYIQNKITGRVNNSYYDTEGLTQYFEHTSSMFLWFMFVVIISSKYAYFDKNNKMDTLIQMTTYGRQKLKKYRYLSLMIVVSMGTIMVNFFMFLAFSSIYRIRGLSNPLFSLKDYMLGFLNIKIVTFICVQVMFNILISWTIAILTYLLSKKMNIYVNNVLSIFISLITWTALYSYNSKLNLNLLAQEFNTISIGSVIVEKYYVMGILILSFFILFSSSMIKGVPYD